MPDFTTLLGEAIRHHQAGQFADAENIYRRILAKNPLHGSTLHMFGLLAHQTGRKDLALKLLGEAINSDKQNPTYLANYGLALERLGRLDEALASYDAALRINPSYARASYNRGNVLFERNYLEDALGSYDASIRANPNFHLAQVARARTLQRLGRLEEALASYDLVLRQEVASDIYFDRGNVLHDLRRFDEAVESYDRALQIDCQNGWAYAAKAATLHACGDLEGSIANYEAALGIQPDAAETHFNCGNAFQALGRMEQAINSYLNALRINPDYQDALLNLGAAQQKLGRLDEALNSYETALRLKPDCLPALLNRASTLHSLSRHHDALAAFEAALRVKQGCAEAHSGCGAAMHDLGRLDDALMCYERALRINSNYAEAHSGRGAVFHDLGQIEKALASFREARRANPHCAEAHMNRGLTLLLTGQLEEGWAEYAWRWQAQESSSAPGIRARRHLLPHWNGDAAAGRTIFLWSEQGLGDAIQFARFVPVMAERGWTVIFEAHAQLAPLFSSFNSALTKVMTDGSPIPAADVQCSLLDLPGMLGISTATMPNSVPYLGARQDLRSFWRSRLPSGGLRVGIAWQGNSRHKNDRNRSIPVKYFSALSKLTDIQLVSLQKGDGVEQLDALSRELGIVNLGADYQDGDFQDTAALVMELDLVITVDTAVAHLAGALGRPVWLALPFVPDWRWGLEGSRSHWYPTARLFRQRAHGEWDRVFGNIAQVLDAEKSQMMAGL